MIDDRRSVQLWDGRERMASMVIEWLNHGESRCGFS